MDDNFEEFKKRNKDCHIPEDWMVRKEYANLPEYMRRYCVWYNRQIFLHNCVKTFMKRKQ